MKRICLAAAFVVCWSSGFVGAAWSAGLAPPAGLLAWRYLITAALLVAIVAPRAVRVRPSELVQQGVLGLLAHVIFLGAVFGASSAGVDAGTVALVCALQPMLVAVIGAVAFRDRLGPRMIIGLGLGLVAVAITVGGVGGPGWLLALPVVSLAGLSGAALLERRWRPRTDLLTGLCIQVVLSAGVFTAYALAAGEFALEPGPRLAGALAWLVIISGIGGYATFLACLRRLGATVTSTLLYLTPPVTVLWAWLMLGQRPDLPQFAGLGIALVAVAIAVPRGEQPDAGADRGLARLRP